MSEPKSMIMEHTRSKIESPFIGMIGALALLVGLVATDFNQTVGLTLVIAGALMAGANGLSNLQRRQLAR